ncbi:hypothetical protein [Cupriavidus sp. CuC1]
MAGVAGGGVVLFGGLVGFSIVSMSGVIRWREQDGVFIQACA